jgi:hypothetical protein
MSVFKVQLQNVKQGLLDLDPSTHPLATGSGTDPATYGQLGDPEDISLQRQIFVAGPGRTYRLLKDGETFTDCNYWKRFTYPTVAQEFAFITTVTDDGSVYSDVPAENVFAAGADGTLSTDYTDTVVDFVTTHGGAARFLQVQNLDSTAVVNGELNGDTNVTFQLAGSETQIFNQGDLSITLLRLKSDSAGSSYSWIASVRSVCNS